MVYVVEIILSNEDIFFSASIDDGKTFGCIIKLNNNRLSDDPPIAACVYDIEMKPMVVTMISSLKQVLTIVRHLILLLN